MANLRVDKITSTETFETTGSVQFDASSGSGLVVGSSDCDFGTGDFTIEGWFLVQDSAAIRTIFDSRTSDNSSTGLFLGINTDDTLYTYGFPSGTTVVSYGTPEPNTWHHVAVVRNGSDGLVFLDGKLVSSGVTMGSSDYTQEGGTIGQPATSFAAGLYRFKGHISNVRVVKGRALYTENFKVPMKELEVVSGTVLLACQSKTDASLEKTGKTITVNGTAVASELTPGILTPIVKSGAGSAITGSVEFDGNNDYLQVTPNSDLSFTGDFTVEYWVYMSKSETHMRQIGSNNYYTAGKNGNWYFGIHNESTPNVYFYTYDGQSNAESVGASFTSSLNSWYHLAAARVGNTVTIYVNGVKLTSGTISKDIIDGSVGGIQIGKLPSYGYHNGFISNLRIVKGTALYTHDFIPPTRELKKVPGTVLLCCQDPDNPLTEATGKTITPYGSLGDGDLGPELVTNNSVWTLTKGGSGATDWTVSNNGSSLAGTTVSGGYIRATYTIPKGDYLVSLRWTGGNFAVQSSAGYIVATDGSSTAFGSSDDGAYSFYMTDTTSVVITGTSWSTAYTVDDISIKRIYRNNGASNFTPQVGDDRKVTFEGVTKINSNAYFYLPTGNTESREATGTYNAGTRGIFGAIEVFPTAGDSIHYATIASFGNTVDFGDLVVAKRYGAGCSSRTRGIWGGGADPAPSPNLKQSSMSYITIASTGDSLNFGDLTTARWGLSAFSNSTRGIFFSGNTTPTNTNVIDYVTIASTGDAVDFGDAFSTHRYPLGSTSDTTRGISAGGHPASDNVIQYITFASTGNAQDFGDLMQGVDAGCGGVSNGTRGVFAGGYNPTQVNTIQYITIQSMGNSKDFGDMTSTDARHGASAESSTRGLFTHGGYPSRLNTIDAITIATTGNAVEFGDIIDIGGNDGGGDSGTQSGFSNGHGGLG